MSERLWIQIPDPDPDKSAWTGILTPPAEPRASWTFELVRSRKSLRTLYDDSPFKWGRAVTGLLDLQKDCTLLGARVLNVGPGSFGVRIRAGRTAISGEFDALLRDLAIANPCVPCIAGVSFESEALGRWLDLPGVGPDRSTPGLVKLNPDASEAASFEVPPWGRMTVRSTMLVNDGARQGAYRAATGVRLDFASPVSLDEATSTAVGLERLFGFIVGFRGKFAPFRLWTEDTYQVGSLDLPLDGTLEVSGFDWQQGEPPSPHDCLSRQASSGTVLSEIVPRFAANREDFIARMYAVEFARQFSKNLNDRFTMVVPLLESYLRRRYASPEEESYMAAREAYFAWVDQAPDPDVRAFGRKHIRLEGRGKAPSLPILIERAIAHVNAAGFGFPKGLGRRIQDRRAKLFHAPATISEGDGARFSADEKGATALLLLHTLEDLGIDIARLAADPFPIRDVTWLFPTPPSSANGPPEPEV